MLRFLLIELLAERVLAKPRLLGCKECPMYGLLLKTISTAAVSLSLFLFMDARADGAYTADAQNNRIYFGYNETVSAEGTILSRLAVVQISSGRCRASFYPDTGGVFTIDAGDGDDDIRSMHNNELKDDSGRICLRFGDFSKLRFTEYRLIGGPGDDYIFGSRNNDTLDGREGNDFLMGMQGNDTVSGGSGDDLIAGSEGLDMVEGGTGRDHYYCRRPDNILRDYDPSAEVVNDICATADRPRVEIIEQRDPYRQWVTTIWRHSGITFSNQTTSSSSVLLDDQRRGAKLLTTSVDSPLHALHKQYGSSCGPCSLAPVMLYLGRARPGTRLFLSRDLNPGPPTVYRAWDPSVAVDVGHYLSPEHIMYEGLRWAYIGRWRNASQRPDWWPKPIFLSEEGLLNTDNTGNACGVHRDRDCGSFLGISYPLGNVRLNRSTGEYAGPVQRWLYHTVGVGGSDLVFVANKFAPGRKDASYADFSDSTKFKSLEHVKAVVRGFVDNNLPAVISIENGGHYNTLMGYLDLGSTFHIYTADPLDGYGRS